MALAGSMKLKHFVWLVAFVGGLAIAGSYTACKRSHDAHEVPKLEAVRPTPVAPTPPPAVTPDAAVAAEAPQSVTPVPVRPSDLEARPYDDEVLAWRGKAVKGGKQKDINHGAAYKIDIYADGGSATASRAKIDANRNGKWDDKITFGDGKITLERSPNDDEKYTETYHWNGHGWTKA